VSGLTVRLILGLAALLMPSRLSRWGRAMASEADAIEQAGPRLSFAMSCLGAAIGQAFHALRGSSAPTQGEIMTTGKNHRPLLLTVLCATAAIALGMAWMRAAGAPLSYLGMNGAALLLGLLAIGVAREASRIVRIPGAAIALVLAGGLLLTALFGVSADGARRWVSAGGVMLQPGLIVVPLIVIQFVRTGDRLSLLAVLTAALALALQPDRAMAGALAAGMAALALVRPGREVLLALAAAIAAFAATLLRPDASGASPFVDGIFYSAFQVHVLAGLAVAGGAALMIVPAIVGWARDPHNRPFYAVFAAVWLAVIAAAALGNYPTPLVGYSGSAILGYLLSAIGLPPRRAARPLDLQDPGRPEAADRPRALREGLFPAG
jgi:hypothetical protein